MLTITETTIDKNLWPRGIWETEPDKIQWMDVLPCLIVRTESGHLCGYVGVGSNHPLFGKESNEVGDSCDHIMEGHNLNVHGGITFTGKCQPDGRICHVVEFGEDDNIWWFGFDCNHFGDRSPMWSSGVYRDIDYVRNECHQLACQLKALEDHHGLDQGCNN